MVNQIKQVFYLSHFVTSLQSDWRSLSTRSLPRSLVSHHCQNRTAYRAVQGWTRIVVELVCSPAPCQDSCIYLLWTSLGSLKITRVQQQNIGLQSNAMWRLGANLSDMFYYFINWFCTLLVTLCLSFQNFHDQPEKPYLSWGFCHCWHLPWYFWK